MRAPLKRSYDRAAKATLPIVRDRSTYHDSEREQLRTRDLLELIPPRGTRALDIGARDGHLSLLLAERFDRVVALDLELPPVIHEGVDSVQGDVTALTYADNSFDTVVCAEVLEHIPEQHLERACREIVRVARHAVVVGVPYRQDLRCGRTTCRTCGRTNPPWGHLSAFDQGRLQVLFRDLALVRFSLVGANRDRTNDLSAALMQFAGNPYGTYDQDEACVHCGAQLKPPDGRTLAQKFATKAAYSIDRVQRWFTAPRANWVHARFDKAIGVDGNGP